VRCRAMLCVAVPCCALPCHAVPCCAVPCCAVPCCAVLCHAVLCDSLCSTDILQDAPDGRSQLHQECCCTTTAPLNAMSHMSSRAATCPAQPAVCHHTPLHLLQQDWLKQHCSSSCTLADAAPEAHLREPQRGPASIWCFSRCSSGSRVVSPADLQVSSQRLQLQRGTAAGALGVVCGAVALIAAEQQLLRVAAVGVQRAVVGQRVGASPRAGP